jgi:hypothetical protein
VIHLPLTQLVPLPRLSQSNKFSSDHDIRWRLPQIMHVPIASTTEN